MPQVHWFSIFYRIKNNNNYPTNQFVLSTVLFVFVIFPLIPIIMECFLNILFLKTNNCKNCLACFKKKLYVPYPYHFKKFFFRKTISRNQLPKLFKFHMIWFSKIDTFFKQPKYNKLQRSFFFLYKNYKDLNS